jgi:Tfp pilus assembly protein PilX
VSGAEGEENWRGARGVVVVVVVVVVVLLLLLAAHNAKHPQKLL